MSSQITEVTRRAIIDYLLVSDTEWSGRLPDSAFLSRLYDLTQLPSTDHRFESALKNISNTVRALVTGPQTGCFTTLGLGCSTDLTNSFSNSWAKQSTLLFGQILMKPRS